jgi:hypothetical protein
MVKWDIWVSETADLAPCNWVVLQVYAVLATPPMVLLSNLQTATRAIPASDALV